jgi:quercetin dioxygenase-like cupin family protein/quinol monooxygenase YgiN
MQRPRVNRIRNGFWVFFVLVGLISMPAIAKIATPDVPVIVLGISPIKREALSAFMPVLLEDVVQGRKEAGNVVFDMYQPIDGAPDLLLVERWRSQADFDAHLKFPYVQEVLDKRISATRKGKAPNAIFLKELSQFTEPKPISEPASTHNIVAAIMLKPQARAKAIQSLLHTVKPGREAQGNLGFDVYQDLKNENQLVIVQRWESAASYRAYLNHPHAKSLHALLKASVTRSFEKDWREVKDIAPHNIRENVMQIIRKAGSQASQKGPTTYFIGTVRIDPLFPAQEGSHVSGALVTFEPGARTAWHTHPMGQNLIVTAGAGWTQCEGGPKEEIKAGDVVSCPCGRRHWHGATDTTAMSHIAIQEAKDGTPVTWMEQVTDEQYLAPVAR